MNEWIVSGRPSGRQEEGLWLFDGSKQQWRHLAEPTCARIPHLRLNSSRDLLVFDCFGLEGSLPRVGILNMNEQTIAWLPRQGYNSPTWVNNTGVVVRSGSSGLVLIDVTETNFVAQEIWRIPEGAASLHLVSFDVAPDSQEIVATIRSGNTTDLYQLQLDSEALFGG